MNWYATLDSLPIPIPALIFLFYKRNKRKGQMISISDHHSIIPLHHRRNYILSSHRKDGLIEWMKEMLNHSFVLNDKHSYHETMYFFEEIIEEYRNHPETSRLKILVPTIGKFHTSLALSQAFHFYDEKYSLSKRRMIPPSVNEIRHILNLGQIISIGKNLFMISFDGDQTLYSDGGNFDDENHELALALIRLLCHQVKVILITAAGYGLITEKYEYRIKELLNRFVEEQMTEEQVNNFYVLGGECHYLFQCKLFPITAGKTTTTTTTTTNKEETKEGNATISGVTSPISDSLQQVHIDEHDSREELQEELKAPSSVSSSSSKKITHCAHLVPVPISDWQADHLSGPKPFYWSKDEIKEILDIAETTMYETIDELKLRAKVLRKEKAVGVFPGGKEMSIKYPIGHGSRKLKQEALDEIVLRVMEAIRQRHIITPFTLPYCVFNGGKDAWIDIGNKSIGVASLQAYFNCHPSQCLHVGDQFLSIGNDIAARQTSPCIWIINPRETGKVLQHVLRYKGIAPILNDEDIERRSMREGKAAMLNVYSGEIEISTTTPATAAINHKARTPTDNKATSPIIRVIGAKQFSKDI